jgi:propanediol dehydratase small subunit
LEFARLLVDINVPQSEILELISGCTAARLVEIVAQMNVLEMMMGLAKIRARRTPANQAHVTNRKEHPALLAAEAAEAADTAGYGQLAENLRRAAELTRISNQQMLEIYEALRPGRSSYSQLTAWADRLDTEYEAPLTAAFMREAAEV